MAVGAVERRPATWEEYQSLGDDVRAEYIDGQIVMSPSPTRRHQNAVDRLKALLLGALPGGCTVTREWSWKPQASANEYVPDLSVHADTDEEYAQAQLDHYWIVDPADAVVQILVRDGEHYVLERVVTTERPETVSFGIAEVAIDLAAVLA